MPRPEAQSRVRHSLALQEEKGWPQDYGWGAAVQSLPPRVSGETSVPGQPGSSLPSSGQAARGPAALGSGPVAGHLPHPVLPSLLPEWASALQTANLIKWAAERLLPLIVGNLMIVSLSQLEGRGGACPAPRPLSPSQAQPSLHDRLSWSSSPGTPAKMRKSCSPGSELLAQLRTDTSSRTCFKVVAGVTHVFAWECTPALPPGLLRSSRRWPWSQE